MNDFKETLKQKLGPTWYTQFSAFTLHNVRSCFSTRESILLGICCSAVVAAHKLRLYPSKFIDCEGRSFLTLYHTC